MSTYMSIPVNDGRRVSILRYRTGVKETQKEGKMTILVIAYTRLREAEEG